MTSRAAVLLAACSALAASGDLSAQGPPSAESCIACHRGLDEERLVRPATLFETDIHAERGFTCLDCHGSAAGTPGFLTRPSRRGIPGLCGRCHSDPQFMRGYNPSLRVDQVAEYYTSAHGRRLRELDDPDVATCVDCHPAHETRPPSDPESSVYPVNVADTCGSCHADPQRMARHDIGTDQLEEYRRGVHGRLMFEDGDVSAPTCNDCHGNHGAAPPGAESVRNVCGQCHATIAEHFDRGGHAGVMERSGMIGCATCHDNHDIAEPSDSLLAARYDGVCRNCHGDDENGRAFLAMWQLIDSLEREFEGARVLLARAENAGMEVSQSQFELEETTNALTKARAAIHDFRLGPVRREVAAGLDITRAAREQAEHALAEHRFRRIGLGLSVTFILALVAALLLMIRDVERAPRRPPGREENVADELRA